VSELELAQTREVQPPPRVNHQWRKEVPEAHRGSLDTRLRWLWNQRFGTVQTVYTSSPDILDHTAATLIIQAIMAKDLRSIRQIFQRLEGGAQFDDELNDDEPPMPL
jgi:hypothetical protein